MNVYRPVEERGDDEEQEEEEEEERVTGRVDDGNAEPMPRMAGRPVHVHPGPVRGALHEMMMEARYPRGMQQWRRDSDDEGGGVGDMDEDDNDVDNEEGSSSRSAGSRRARSPALRR
jgi:hypothetical protein